MFRIDYAKAFGLSDRDQPDIGTYDGVDDAAISQVQRDGELEAVQCPHP